MTSEVVERPRFVTGSYGRHRSQWVNAVTSLFVYIGPEKPRWGVANYVYVYIYIYFVIPVTFFVPKAKFSRNRNL